MQKIHACRNHCILYRNKNANLLACPECKSPRFKNNDRLKEGEELKKGIPALVMWYLPIIPRLKCFFANPRDAELTCWNEDKRKKDRMLRHPTDAMQWRKIDTIYPTFGGDPRNLRFGLSTDGMNPFGERSSTHSTWLVILTIYNLPPGFATNESIFCYPFSYKALSNLEST